MQKHWREMGPHKLKIAWRIEDLDSPHTVSFVASNEPRSAVRYNYWLNIHDVVPISLIRIRVTRAPQYDAIAASLDPFRFSSSYNALGWYNTYTRETMGICEGMFGPDRRHYSYDPH
jgi:hypothetical protein